MFATMYSRILLRNHVLTRHEINTNDVKENLGVHIIAPNGKHKV